MNSCIRPTGSVSIVVLINNKEFLYLIPKPMENVEIGLAY